MVYTARVARDGEIIIDRFPDWNDIPNQTLVSAVRSNARADSSGVINNHVTTNHENARNDTTTQPMKSVSYGDFPPFDGGGRPQVTFGHYFITASIGTIGGIKGPGTLDAEPGKFPYLVNIVDYWNKDLIGSGVLIESRVVLTTGYEYANSHPYRIVVILGEYDRSNGTEVSKQEIKVSKIVLHPELEGNGAIDIALLHLEEEPELGEMVQTFGLENIVSSYKEDKNIHKKSGACVVPGFGFTEWTKFRMIWPKTLKKYIPDMMEPFGCTGPYFRKLFLCARNTDLTSTCKYDGGAPLLCKKGGRVKLFGLTMGLLGYTQYCDEGQSLFTRVSTYYKWINRISKQLQQEESDEFNA